MKNVWALFISYFSLFVLLLGSSIYLGVTQNCVIIPPPVPLPEFLVLGVKCKDGLKGNVVFDITRKGFEKLGKQTETSGSDGFAKIPFDFEEEGKSLKIRLTYDSLSKWTSLERAAIVKKETLILAWESYFPGKPCFQGEEPKKPCVPVSVLADSKRHIAKKNWNKAVELLKTYFGCMLGLVDTDLEASLMYGQATFMDNEDNFESAEACIQPVAATLGTTKYTQAKGKNKLLETAWYYLVRVRLKKYEESDSNEKANAKNTARETARTYLRIFGYRKCGQVPSNKKALLESFSRNWELDKVILVDHFDEVCVVLNELTK